MLHQLRLDVCACGFWQADQMAFFDVRVFDLNARRYAKQKHIKRRNAFTMNELCRLGMAHLHHLWCVQLEEWDKNYRNFICGCQTFINEKRESSYSAVATWTQRKLVFAFIKSTGMCLRGSRSIFHQEKLEQSIKDDELLSELSSKV